MSDILPPPLSRRSFLKLAGATAIKGVMGGDPRLTNPPSEISSRKEFNNPNAPIVLFDMGGCFPDPLDTANQKKLAQSYQLNLLEHYIPDYQKKVAAYEPKISEFIQSDDKAKMEMLAEWFKEDPQFVSAYMLSNQFASHGVYITNKMREAWKTNGVQYPFADAIRLVPMEKYLPGMSVTPDEVIVGFNTDEIIEREYNGKNGIICPMTLDPGLIGINRVTEEKRLRKDIELPQIYFEGNWQYRGIAPWDGELEKTEREAPTDNVCILRFQENGSGKLSYEFRRNGQVYRFDNIGGLQEYIREIEPEIYEMVSVPARVELISGFEPDTTRSLDCMKYMIQQCPKKFFIIPIGNTGKADIARWRKENDEYSFPNGFIVGGMQGDIPADRGADFYYEGGWATDAVALATVKALRYLEGNPFHVDFDTNIRVPMCQDARRKSGKQYDSLLHLSYEREIFVLN